MKLKRFKSSRIHWGIIIAVAVVLVLAIVIPTVLNLKNSEKGAIVSNGSRCADIGMKIMKKYGNAVDTMIATMICDGLLTMNNMGLGGGFIATIYIRSIKKAYALNARETAPKAAKMNMFENNTAASKFGGLSVAVPGELRGYWEMYQKFGGKAPWAELFTDSINLCLTGIPINRHVATNIKTNEDLIKSSPSLHGLLSKPDGQLVGYGDTVKNPQLAHTLKLIAEKGPDVLYEGELTERFVEDVRKAGGILTTEDMANYRVKWEEPVTEYIGPDLTLYSVPAPASGPILAWIFKTLDKSGLLKGTKENVFAITEAFKFAYGLRAGMGDPDFVKFPDISRKLEGDAYASEVAPKLNVNQTSNDISYYEGTNYLTEDHGTANMVVIAPNGDTIVATSTVNLIFGSKLVSESTGIILNDEMDDFSTPQSVNYFGVPPSSVNFIRPGARPVSSMCPAIFVNRKTGDVRLAVGGAGGTRITTATAIVAIRNLFYNQDIIDAIAVPRYHHQLYDMLWYHEADMSEDVVDEMKRRGHRKSVIESINSCVTAISVENDKITASSDYRRLGNVSYY